MVTRQYTQIATVEFCTDLDHDWMPIACVLEYRQSDPYAMTLRFPTQKDTSWTFSRSLLLLTLENAAPVGDGDVCVFYDPSPDADDVTFHFTSPEGECYLRLPVTECHEFAAAMELLVPLGMEPAHLDIDGWIDRILAEVKP